MTPAIPRLIGATPYRALDRQAASGRRLDMSYRGRGIRYRPAASQPLPALISAGPEKGIDGRLLRDH
jgi:hypothetical protein